MGLLATALMCTAMGAGCGGPPAVHAGPRPAAHFAIAFERSGGFAAQAQMLVIRPGRRAYLSRRTRVGFYPKTTRFKVGVKRIESLRRALARAEFASIESPVPGPVVCADCYRYDIAYRSHEVTFDQATMPKPLAPVLKQLDALIDAH